MFRIGNAFLRRTAMLFGATMAAVVAAALLAPTQAQAAGQPWSVQASNGTSIVAKAYGDFANNGGVYATVGANWVDMSNNGNPVYVEVEWQFYVWSPQFGWYWATGGDNSQTARSSRMKYVSGSLSRKLDSGGTKAKAKIKVCEDRNNAKDICSGYQTLIFDY
jgi:hypothetical protein